MPIEVASVPTAREQDGLAMSSRNGYLTAAERARAPTLYRALVTARDAIRAGERDHETLCRQARETLAGAGFRPDYFSVRRAEDLSDPAATDRDLVILGAAWLGKARLIDNIRV